MYTKPSPFPHRRIRRTVARPNPTAGRLCVPIDGVIDLGRAPSVGRVDATVLIRDALLRARVRTVACVNERAMAEAFRQGNLGIMDYYRMKNVQADTSMRTSIAGDESEPPTGPTR